jgi:flagellar biosynthesis GTPase FlhF
MNKYIKYVVLLFVAGCSNSSIVKTPAVECTTVSACQLNLDNAEERKNSCHNGGNLFLVKFNPPCFEENQAVIKAAKQLENAKKNERDLDQQQYLYLKKLDAEREAREEKTKQELLALEAEKIKKEQLELKEKLLKQETEKQEKISKEKELARLCQNWIDNNCHSVLVNKTNCTTEVYRTYWGVKTTLECDENYKAICKNEDKKPENCSPISNGNSIYSNYRSPDAY